MNWLFEGRQTGEKYSERSLQVVLKQALQKVGNPKQAQAALVAAQLCHPPIWNREQTLGTFRTCWGIAAAKPPRYTPM